MAIKPIEILIRAKDEASSVLDLLKRNAAGVGAAIAGYFGFNAFVGAVKGAADLESALSEVAAVSGSGAAEMAKLRAAAEEAGSSTKFTATEAAVALGNLARSGLNSNQAIAALKPTLQLAQAGSIDLGQAAEITTKAIAGFGLKAEDAGRIADVLAKGANASNTSVRGLGEAMSYAAPMAKSVGLDLESTVAIMGKFADGGIDASRAGTALNSILSQFADPSSKFKAALSDAGITTTDFNKALVQLAGAGDRGQKAILAVGTEAGPALRSLLNQGIPALTALRNELQSAGGSAEATAKIMGDNLNGAISGLSSAWDAVKVKLATPVLPVLKEGIDRVAASLKSAVDGGLISKFGDAIANGFRSAMEWGTKFLKEIDFSKLSADMKAAADRVGESFDRIRQSADNAGDVFNTVFGVLKAGFNAILIPIYKFGEVFATVQQGILTGISYIAEKMSTITFGDVSKRFAEAAANIKTQAEATGAVADAMGKKADDAFQAMADGAQQARDGFTGLSTSAQSAAPNVEGVAAAANTASTQLDGMGKSATEAGSKAAASTKDLAEKAEAAKSRVAELKVEYAAAVRSGDFSAQIKSLKELETATAAAKVAMDKLGGSMDDVAKNKASKIAAAFVGMGIQTKAQLKEVADTAKDRFETIKSSGLATTDGLQEAFKKMAQAAIDANGGIAPATIKAQAEMYKLKITTDEFGKSVISAMDSGTTGAHKFGAAVADATSALEAQNAALERNIAALEKANDLKERAAELERKRLNVDKEGFSLNTAGKRIEESVPTTNGIYNQLTAAGMDPTTANQLAGTLAKRAQSAMKGSGLTGGAIMPNVDDFNSRTLQDHINDAIRNYQVSGNSGKVNTTSGGGVGTSGGAAKTYNVQIGGRTIKTNSDADAQALIGALKDAQRAA